jgi:tRNA-modifying protein YgfZ
MTLTVDGSKGYRAAVAAAAIFDVSDAGNIVASGADAPKFLTNLSTNDLREIPLGGGCETYFLDHKAKTLFQSGAYHVLVEGKHAIWLETTPGRGGKLFAHLDRYLISEAVELTDATDRYSQFHLSGPSAHSTLESALADKVPDLAEFQHLERTFGRDIVASIRRRDTLGTPGYDLVVPVEHGEALLGLLIAAGATVATPEDFEVLRIEAGTPIYGPDIDETRFVMEIARVERAVSYTKGCFIGQEPIVMARDRAGFVNRAFLKLKIDGDPLPPGTKLTRDGQDAGVVTSSTRSPRYGTIALGYIRRGHQDPGTRLAADTTTVEVVGTPA